MKSGFGIKIFQLFFKFYLFLKRFYLFIHKKHRERQRHRQRENQAPCREPDVGLNPRTPGSRPEPKTDAQPLSHPGVPFNTNLNIVSNQKISVRSDTMK